VSGSLHGVPVKGSVLHRVFNSFFDGHFLAGDIPNSFHPVAAGKTLSVAINFPIPPFDPTKIKDLNTIPAQRGPDEAAGRSLKGWACSYFQIFL
jgi:hypothetical protein